MLLNNGSSAGICAKHQYRYWAWPELKELILVLQWPRESLTLCFILTESCSFPPLHQLWSLLYLFSCDFSYLMQQKHFLLNPPKCTLMGDTADTKSILMSVSSDTECFDECLCWHEVGSVLAPEGTLRFPAFSSSQLWTHWVRGNPTSMDNCPMDAPIQKRVSIPHFVASVPYT